MKLVVFAVVCALFVVAGINQLQKMYLPSTYGQPAGNSNAVGSPSVFHFPEQMKAGFESMFGNLPVLSTAGAAGSTARAISVTGQGSVSSAPDDSSVSLRVETDSESAAKSQKQNADITAIVRAALIATGVDASKIESSSYSVSPRQEYDEKTRTYANNGYRTTHSLRVKLGGNIEGTGKVVDAAVGAGALVDNIQFGLSTAKQGELSKSALSLAGKDALAQATVLADSLGVKIKGLSSASVGGSYNPYPLAYAKNMAVGTSEGAPTQVTPGQLTISSSVSAVFEVE